MTYYMVDPQQYVQLINYSGCGNTVNANHPVVKQLIIDSLVHFVEEYHVDGFRFDLASCLCRGKVVLCGMGSLFSEQSCQSRGGCCIGTSSKVCN